MEECIFCKIANKSLFSFIVWEDNEVMAFLDIYPKSEGMVIVIPKQHYENFEENENLSLKVAKVAFEIAKTIKEVLNASFVGIGYLPSQIKHFHLRVYPYYENQIPLIENKPIEVSKDKLQEIAQKISSKISIKFEEKKEEKKIEVKKEEKKEESEERKKLVEVLKKEMEIA
ncbi:MAG: hypothetical protein B6U78_00930 [Candidatus Aenigmarchaeota archaeon ex4484_224]|nr:MAG: hypothetical protein B6U78_00930 [Candidatus Aenigmarchaeota archaeon ex4484_224]